MRLLKSHGSSCVKLFNQAPTHGVKCSVFVGDDDSTTIAKIRQVQCNVEKWSDASHATRAIVGQKQDQFSRKKSAMRIITFPEGH